MADRNLACVEVNLNACQLMVKPGKPPFLLFSKISIFRLITQTTY